MKHRTAIVVATLVLALSACGDEQTPIESVTPTPWPGDVTTAPTPTPTATPTPSQAELSAEAERVYRAFFTEWKRLQMAGGADEPTQPLIDNAGGSYLDAVMKLLREQRASGRKVLGPPATTRIKPAPGDMREGTDPRLTIQVCEDSSAGKYVIDGVEHPGYLVEGNLYLGRIDGRTKILVGNTKRVDRCGF